MKLIIVLEINSSLLFSQTCISLQQKEYVVIIWILLLLKFNQKKWSEFFVPFCL